MRKIFSFLTLNRNYLGAAAMYLGVALLLLALVPTQSRVIGMEDDCDCPEDAVCTFNEEGQPQCTCPLEY